MLRMVNKKTTNLHCSCSCRDFRKRRFYWHTRASVSCMVTSAFHLSMCTRTPFLASCVCMRRTRRFLGCCLSSSGASLSYLSSNTSSLFLEQMTMEKVLLFSAHFFSVRSSFRLNTANFLNLLAMCYICRWDICIVLVNVQALQDWAPEQHT